MKNHRYVTVLSLVVILLLLLYTFFISGVIGTSKNKIEEKARKSQKIDSSWLCVKDVTDEMGVLLFYNSEINDHTFSIYLNRDDFSYGYFFVKVVL